MSVNSKRQEIFRVPEETRDINKMLRLDEVMGQAFRMVGPISAGY
jgi:hypothetical protein